MRVEIGAMVVALRGSRSFLRGKVVLVFEMNLLGRYGFDNVIKSMQNDKDRLNASSRHFGWLELATSITSMTSICGVLKFGNSYIKHEQEIVAE